MCWQAAKGALSLPGADTVLRVILDDVSTNTCECYGVRVLLVDDEAEVAEVGCNSASICIWAGVEVPESI